MQSVSGAPPFTMHDNFCAVGVKTAVELLSTDAAVNVDAQAAARQYPDRSRRMQEEGEAGFRCASDDHRLVNCVITSETPTDWGFARAALAVIQSDAVRTHREMKRRAIGGTVVFKITDRGSSVLCPGAR